MHDARFLEPRLAHVAGERPQQRLAEQIVQDRVRLADQPLERAGEPRELSDPTRGEQPDHVPPHRVEQHTIVGTLRCAERPPVRRPRFTKAGARAKEGGFEEGIGHPALVSSRVARATPVVSFRAERAALVVSFRAERAALVVSFRAERAARSRGICTPSRGVQIPRLAALARDDRPSSRAQSRDPHFNAPLNRPTN